MRTGKFLGLVSTMPDKRTVDELSIEELEKILAIKKREARQANLQRMKRSGRVIENTPPQPPKPADEGLPEFINKALSNPALNTDEQAMIPPEKAKSAPGLPQFVDQDDLRKLRKRKNSDDNGIWRRFVDRSLLLVEVAAVIGLIVVGFTMLEGINTLQRETASAQSRADEQLRAAIPTIEATPTLRLANIVLPSGHTPPTEAGSEFNYDEVPANLRSFVREQMFPTEIQRPPITPQTARRIIIPDINVDATIVQGVDWEALRLGVGQLPNEVTPASSEGNVVLAAHNDIYGEIFRYLDELEPGMQFQIQTESQIHTYMITGWDIVEPNQVEVMENVPGKATATLISCYPYQVNDKRYIVYAERVD